MPQLADSRSASPHLRTAQRVEMFAARPLQRSTSARASALPQAPGGRAGKPLITVITAVLNGAAHLEQCIRSVAGQTYPLVEFIVIDGGSTDGSLDIMRKHEQSIAYWISEPDLGIYDALNKGLRVATGDWICVIGSDDYLVGDTVLETFAARLAECDPEIKLAYGSVAMQDGEDTLCLVGPPWAQAKRALRECTAVPYTGLMHRRSWFERYGLYDPSFRIAGDYEMLLRGWPREDALHVPGLTTLAMRIGGISNVSSTAFASLREVDRARAMHDVKPPVLYKRKVLAHTVVRYILQKAWKEDAMWRLKRLRERIFGTGRPEA
jgi:glycosyltransferase involved in cell wall biosynthesis